MVQFLYRSDWPLAARGAARVKLNGTVLYRRVIFKDIIPGIEVFRNPKSQAPNFKETQNFNIQ